MKKLFAVFRLVRWVNLLIIAGSMYFFQLGVIRLYIMGYAHLQVALDWFYYSLLVLAVVLIAAAGNVVNAYFDYEQDMEYRPERTIIGRYISLDSAFMLQMGLNVAGVLIGFFLAYHFDNIRLGYIFLSCAALLWMYSQVLKKYFLIGNIVVAGLCAFVFVMPVLFEYHVFFPMPSEGMIEANNIIVLQLKWYFLFAFTVSLMREIVKDAEDKEADRAYGMSTLPVVLARAAVNAIIVILLLLTMIAIGCLQAYFWRSGLKKHFWYAFFFLQFPMITDIFLALASRNQKDYHNLSILLKMLMFFGIASLPLYYWFIWMNMPK